MFKLIDSTKGCTVLHKNVYVNGLKLYKNLNDDVLHRFFTPKNTKKAKKLKKQKKNGNFYLKRTIT